MNGIMIVKEKICCDTICGELPRQISYSDYNVLRTYNDVVKEDEASNDEALSDLNSVYASIYIDGISAKNS